MNKWFTRLPLRRKLILLATFASVVTLLIASTVLSVTDYHKNRAAMIHRLGTEAELTALSSEGALAFADPEAAQKTLQALAADRAIIAAEIRSLKGDSLATVSFPMEAKGAAPANVQRHGFNHDHMLHMTADVKLDEPLGTVHIWATDEELERALAVNLLIQLGVFVAALAVTLLAAARLQGVISAPILTLAATTSAVSRSRDFSLRVRTRSADEIGQLIDSFNDMLEQIETRDRQLHAHKAELEQKVASRTAELATALQDAQAAARTKSEFLANMSHEIRTPMNGVIGMLDLLHGANLERTQRSMVETARKSADALLTLINDLLDFSKIEAGKLRLEHIDFDLRAIVEEVATLFSRQAAAKDIELSCVIHRDVPTLMRGDPTRLRQIISSMAGNAVKFTEHGEVFIGVKSRPDEAHDDVLPIQIVVRDTGIGMTPDSRSRLFEAFTQADGSTTRKYGGAGLGLAITKGLLDAMHGSIKVGSELGQGSTFSVIVPLHVRQSTTAGPPADLQNLKALIVDDNPTNRCILEHYLDIVGMRHDSAASAREGLNMVRSAVRATHPYDIVLLDYQMPELDGVGFVREMRSDPQIAQTQCAVLSSLGDRPAAVDSLQVAAWLTKPVRQAQLTNMLSAVIGQNGDLEQTTSAEPAAAPLPAQARVLLVEDNRVNQEVAIRLLATLGIEPQIANDGTEAVARVQENNFDIALMDCQMPGMDGYEATQVIRAWERDGDRPRLPIVAMTANAMQGDRERCLASGMDDYVSKPIKRAVLVGALTRWLKAEAPSNPVPKQEPDLEKTMDLEALTQETQLDMAAVEQLRELFDGDVSDVVATYLRDTPEQIASVASALAAGDLNAAGRAAHSLKSSSYSIGARVVGELAQHLEAHLREAGSVTEARDMLAKLEGAAAAVSPQLQAVAANQDPRLARLA